MRHDFNFADILSSSWRAAWQIEYVLPAGARLDFDRRFMPEVLARTATIPFLRNDESLILNQVRGREYLALIGLVEEFILPFVLDHARPQLNGDDERVRALLNFASEEAKQVHLFRQFERLFDSSFGTRCEMIGPPEAIAAEILRHDPLAVALVILMIEWATQSHYLDSVRGDQDLDPLFKSLLRHHWMEEAQHARVDTLMVMALGGGRDEAGMERAIHEFLEILAFLDSGLKQQASFNLDAFEAASGRRLSIRERQALDGQQHQALRWTYLGSAMLHPKFTATLTAISSTAGNRIAQVAPTFA